MDQERPIRWGILGTGEIARRFAAALAIAKGARLVAVGSRSETTAAAFAEIFGVVGRHASYEALAHDPEVDVVYVATPHALHAENTLLCLAAGKAVLCEKPFTVNARQAADVVREARARRLFVMEAMWTRCFPVVKQIRAWLAEGAIGEPRMLQAAFGFRADPEELVALSRPELGGGSLLDVGVYPVALASMVFVGPPESIVATARLGPTCVDEQAVFALQWPGGALAMLGSAITTETPEDAWIAGTRGKVAIHAPFYCPSKATLSVNGAADVVVEVPLRGSGLVYEAEEVMRCLREGRLESEAMPLDESTAIMRTLDAVRAACGVVYPMDG